MSMGMCADYRIPFKPAMTRPDSSGRPQMRLMRSDDGTFFFAMSNKTRAVRCKVA